jgi:hypothetical protein
MFSATGSAPMLTPAFNSSGKWNGKILSHQHMHVPRRAEASLAGHQSCKGCTNPWLNPLGPTLSNAHWLS